MSRRTKIVATLGPATDSPDALDAVLRAGVDVARVNFSHGAPDEPIGRTQRFRDAARRVGKFAALMADLPGPKLRVKIPAARFLNIGDAVSFSLVKSNAAMASCLVVNCRATGTSNARAMAPANAFAITT